MDAFLVQLGENIRRLRKEREMTQQGLAAAVNTTRNTIARIERGDQNPNILLLANMAFVFDVRISTVLRDCEKKAKKKNSANFPSKRP